MFKIQWLFTVMVAVYFLLSFVCKDFSNTTVDIVTVDFTKQTRQVVLMLEVHVCNSAIGLVIGSQFCF